MPFTLLLLLLLLIIRWLLLFLPLRSSSQFFFSSLSQQFCLVCLLFCLLYVHICSKLLRCGVSCCSCYYYCNVLMLFACKYDSWKLFAFLLHAINITDTKISSLNSDGNLHSVDIADVGSLPKEEWLKCKTVMVRCNMLNATRCWEVSFGLALILTSENKSFKICFLLVKYILYWFGSKILMNINLYFDLILVVFDSPSLGG